MNGRYPAAALAAVVLAGTVLGCSSAPPPPAKPTAPDRPYRWEKEGEIPPLRPEEVGLEVDGEEITVAEEEITFEKVRPDTSPAGGALAFRVQVIATSNRSGAQKLSRRLQEELHLPVAVLFEGGLYKVRVGKAASRKEAERVLAKCRAAGFSDAWIVVEGRE